MFKLEEELDESHIATQVLLLAGNQDFVTLQYVFSLGF
jgi:hypothetical protein